MKNKKLAKLSLFLAIPSILFIIYTSIINNVWLPTLAIAVVIFILTLLISAYFKKKPTVPSRAEEKKENTVEFFVYFSGLLVIVTTSFYFILRNFDGIQQHFNSAELPLSDIAESLNVIAGVPVAFAGSIVAIVISQRALTITTRQERQEDITYIQNQIDKINSVYWPLVVSLRQLLHASIKVRDMKVSNRAVDIFQSATLNLIAALDEINKIGIARECWDESVKIHTNRTTDLLWSQPNAELLPEYLELEIASLPTLIYSLENAMMGITTHSIISKKEYFFPRQQDEKFEVSQKVTHKVKENPTDYNIVINDVLFSGLLMYSRNVDSKGVAEVYTLNIGAAILADLIAFIPSIKTISTCLDAHIESVGIDSEKYSHIVKRLMADIEFQDGIPDGLNNSSNFIKDNPQYLSDSEAFLAEINIKDNPYHNYIFTQMI